MNRLIAILLSSIYLSAGIQTNIGHNLYISFPAKASIDKTFKSTTSFFATSANCNFTVMISEIPDVVFPKNKQEESEDLDIVINKSKEKNIYIK